MARCVFLALAALPGLCLADQAESWLTFDGGPGVAAAAATVPMAPWALLALGIVLGACAVLAPRFRAACTLALVAALLAPLLTGAALTEFRNGEVADADEVNANFQLLQQQIDELRQLVDADADGFTPAQGDCDDTNPEINPGAPEVCDGSDNNCSGVPDDADANASCGLAAACGTPVCSAGQCDINAAPDTQICRASTGACDVAERCDGVSTGCPPDQFEPNGTLCRAASGPCDVPETCQSGTCSANEPAPSGQACPVPIGGQCFGFSCQCPPGQQNCGSFCFAGPVCP